MIETKTLHKPWGYYLWRKGYDWLTSAYGIVIMDSRFMPHLEIHRTSHTCSHIPCNVKSVSSNLFPVDFSHEEVLDRTI